MTVASYSPVGNIRDIWASRDDELLVEGPAGTGKTLGILWKLFVAAQKYQGMRAAIVRQVRASMTQTVLKTFENEVLPASVKLHSLNQSYRIGKSEIIVSGLDSPDKLLSGQFDLIYYNEATDSNTEGWEILTGRLRNGKMPYDQLIGDCNPKNPLHHINTRASSGLMRRIVTTHQDNPAYWDASRQDWTELGKRYIKRLERMTGSRRARFLEGLWQGEEGLVFDTWLDDWDYKDNPTGNVTTEAEYIEGGGEVVWAVDDGYRGKKDKQTGFYTADSHPRVFLLAQLRHDGRIAIFAEHHAVNKLAETHVKEVLELPYPKPRWAAVESSPELKIRIQKQFIPVRGKPSSVDESIKNARSMVSLDENGVRSVLAHPRCKLLRSEFGLYAYGDNEKPIKQYDHAMDAIRYLLWQMRFR